MFDGNVFGLLLTMPTPLRSGESGAPIPCARGSRSLGIRLRRGGKVAELNFGASNTYVYVIASVSVLAVVVDVEVTRVIASDDRSASSFARVHHEQPQRPQ